MKKMILGGLATMMLGMFVLMNGCSKKEPQEVDAPIKLVVATVNNPSMVLMKEHTDMFTAETGIEVQYVVLPENELRQKVTQDVALGSGNYDVVTIGTYDTPFWAENGWIDSLEPYFQSMDAESYAKFDRDDIFSAVQVALSSKSGELYALPFYAEGSIVMYRTDVFEQAGLKMPYEPTWQQIYDFAKQLHDPAKGFYGIVLRGLPGWGQNMAPFGTIINAFGARWFDEAWRPQFTTQEMKDAWAFYKNILKDAGEPGATSVGFTEALALMSSGKAAMWYDASSGAGPLVGSEGTQVKDTIDYALAPTAKKQNTTWFWAWALAIESSSKNKDAAFTFLTWATSKEYIRMIGESVGWENVPPGTRKSTYQNSEYTEAAEFAKITYDSIFNADYNKPTVDPVPYQGIQYVSIPEFQGLGEKVAQELAAYIADNKTLDAALQASQAAALEVAKSGGYLQE